MAYGEDQMTDKLRVGVIGAGRWAGFAHLPGWKRSPLVDLVAVCDVDREKAEARAKEFSIPDVETDYQKLLSRSDIDVIDIVTSGDNHEPLTFDTLNAGKHCWWRSRSARLPGRVARACARYVEGTEDEGRPDVPLRNRPCSTCTRSSRTASSASLTSSRLGAELPVDRSGGAEPLHARRYGRRSDQGRLARRLRRADDRHQSWLIQRN